MMLSFLSRTLGRATSTAGALTLLGLACACSSGQTGHGGTGGSGGAGGSPDQVACVSMTTSASGGPVTPWSRDYEMRVETLDTDRNGGIFLGGSYMGQADLGLGLLPAAKEGGNVVARVSADGTVLWNHAWTDSTGLATTIAADSCGDVFVARVLALDSGRQALTLAKLDSKGVLLWEHTYPDELSYKVFRLVVDAHGDVAMSGHIDGVLQLGDGAITATGGSTGFVALFSGGTGETRWTRPVEAASTIGIGAELSGDLFVTGNLSRVGGTGIAPSPTPDGSLPLARLGPSGDIKAITRTGPSPQSDTTTGAFVVSPQGDVGAAEMCRAPDESASWCVLRFASDGSPGVHQIVGEQNPWSSSWQDTARLTFDAEGNLLMLNQAFLTVNPAKPVSNRLNLTRMSPAGAILRADSWPSGGPAQPVALRVDSAGAVLFIVTIDINAGGTIDVGEGPLGLNFVARHAP
jgi:hypothetical protein